jgi:phospholipid transport system substrate-binding protein
MRQILWILLSLALTWSVAGYASAGDPSQIVKGTVESVLERVRADGESLRSQPQKLHTLVDEFIVPHFDFERMSRWVLGKHWQTTPDAQRTQFVGEFRKLMIRTYASSLLKYANQKVNFLPVRGEQNAKDVVVKTEVGLGSTGAIPINYRMYLANDDWKVYDVAVDGISLLSTYRGEFGGQIRQVGMDGLINKIAAKNAN